MIICFDPMFLILELILKYLRESVAYGKETITRDVKGPAEFKINRCKERKVPLISGLYTIQGIFRLTFAGKR